MGEDRRNCADINDFFEQKVSSEVEWHRQVGLGEAKRFIEGCRDTLRTT